MAGYTAKLTWTRGAEEVFTDGKYSRAHEISFDGGITMPASSSPHVVPKFSRLDAVDPEEMLVASLSSCHALFFLDFARRAGFIVDAYVDEPVGDVGKDERGRISMTKVTLNPAIQWGGDKTPTAEELREIHHKSHEACFIANSFRGDIVIAGGEAH